MKLRIADRILVAIAGLLILALCAGIISQLFLQVDVIAWVAKVFENDTLEIRAVLIGLAVFLLLLGVYCVFVLSGIGRERTNLFSKKMTAASWLSQSKRLRVWCKSAWINTMKLKYSIYILRTKRTDC